MKFKINLSFVANKSYNSIKREVLQDDGSHTSNAIYRKCWRATHRLAGIRPIGDWDLLSFAERSDLHNVEVSLCFTA